MNPYVGGKPSPSPDYPQEIKSVVNPVIKVRGKNLFDFSRLVSDGVNVIDYDKQTITIPAYTNNTGYNQTLRDLCPGITPGIYVFSVKRSNPDSGSGSYFLEAELDFNFNIPTELTDALLDNHIAWYNNVESNIENVISEIQIEKGTEATDYEPYHEEQIVTLPYTLNAIPVSNGGNVTINGQQYIADYVDVEKGKVVRKIDKIVLTGEERWEMGFEDWGTYPYAFRLEGLKNVLIGNAMNAKYSWYEKHANAQINSLNAPYDNCIAVSDSRFSTVDEFTNELKKQNSNGNPLIVYYVMITPQEEINLAPEVIEQYKKLSVKAQTTIIENNYNTWMKATYKSTESV